MIIKDLSIPLRNPKIRELSPFMASQLLYDFATKNLDPIREQAVSKALQDSPELTKALDDIIYGMTYCHRLQKTQINIELINKLKSSKNKFKQYRNFRHWSQSSLWLLESVGISILIILVSLIIPWPRYLKLFLDKQNPELFLSEIPKDTSFTHKNSDQNPIGTIIPTSEYRVVGEIRSVNPEFTLNKLLSSLPRLGASIEHHSLRKSVDGELVPFLKISIPTTQTEALVSGLKLLGMLTWRTPPSENDKGSNIFGMELWVLRQESPKGEAPAKDENGE